MSPAQHLNNDPVNLKTASQRQRSTGGSATRMARLRERRQRGFRCYVIEVSDTDIDGLIAQGLLDHLERNDPTAVEHAIGVLLDRLHC